MKLPVRTQSSSIAFRSRSFGAVDAALETQAGEAVAIFNGRYAPPAGGDGAPASLAGAVDVDYQGVFTNLGIELRAAHRDMVAANTVHLGQLARIVALQERRTSLTQGLSSRFLKARHGLEGLFGTRRGFPMLAVAGDTPRDPRGLVHQVRETVDFLQQPKVELPALDLDGFQIDLVATATQLSGEADELDEVLTELDRARKDAEVTREAKNDAIDGFDDVFLWVGRALESYFHLAGMHELAERVRPSTRRPGRREIDVDTEPISAQASDGEASPERSPEEPEPGSASSEG